MILVVLIKTQKLIQLMEEMMAQSMKVKSQIKIKIRKMEVRISQVKI